jgi:hypothetical protein
MADPGSREKTVSHYAVIEKVGGWVLFTMLAMSDWRQRRHGLFASWRDGLRTLD